MVQIFCAMQSLFNRLLFKIAVKSFEWAILKSSFLAWDLATLAY
jgi:hypothetical protein